MFEALADLDDNDKMRFIAAVLKSQEAGELLECGDHAAGIAAYREAIHISPPCPLRGDYHILLGHHFFIQGEAAAAEQEFLAAISGEGSSYPYEAYRRLAIARAAQGRFPEAIADIRRAAAEGEDAAFAAQALAIYQIAANDLAAARLTAETSFAGTETELEYRRRLSLIHAELIRLAGDHAGFRTALAMPTTEGEEMHPEVALWMATLDRVSGRDDLRPGVAATFATDADDWTVLAWDVLNDRTSPADLFNRLESLSWGERAECLSLYRRLAGLLAEHRGDVADARRHYEAARIEPFTRWCLDYHLAGIGLERLGSA